MQFLAFPDREAAVSAVADRIADALAAALKTGPASLALPGGTTPAPVMEALSRMDLDWSRVTVLPGDERLVPVDHPRSNAGLIRRHLLQGPAAAAKLRLLQADADLGDILPLTVNLVGMGEDAHIASLFPDTQGLEIALSGHAPPVMRMRAPDGEERLSLTAPVLKGAALNLIFITGRIKKDVIEAAAKKPAQTAPVALLLDAASIYWAE